MKTGMLWFDNDPKADLATKIQRAAEYYQKKYGQIPTHCYVHPTMIPKDGVQTFLSLYTSRQVLPNHLWLGCESKL